MKLVTSELMRRIDRDAIERVGIPGSELMENAGRGIADAILEDVIQNKGNAKVAIFCGKGNNGGDGFVVGRYLREAGLGVTFYLLGSPDQLSPDARLNFDRSAKLEMKTRGVNSIKDLPEELDCDYIIDAIFGTGFEGAPRDLFADVIDYINYHHQTVIAIDIPSGLNADCGSHEGAAVEADYTFTLALPKYGLYVSPGRELAGYVDVIPIGIPDSVVDKLDIKAELITPMEVSERLPIRKPDGHKGDFGKVFILAGSTGLTGAAVLAAKSSLRAGCGLAKVGCPRSVLPIIASGAVEATTMALPDVAKKGALALRGLGEIRLAVKEHDAVIIGPGLGSHHETYELVRRLVTGMEKPCIIDADGINALAGHVDLFKQNKTPMIITPHPGEFKRLTGIAIPENIHERIDIARTFASQHNIVLVLKGSPTIVVDTDGSCYVNQTGNNGMATGGSGDVLSGIIGSFLAQGMEPIDAAVCAVFIHGSAGDFAADQLTERCLIAGDILMYLPNVFSVLR